MKDFEEVATQYAPMVSAIIRKLHIYRDYDTFRQIGNIALWQAWMRFEDAKGNFTPFAYRSIQGAMLDELKRETRRNDQATYINSIQEEEGESVAEGLPDWLEVSMLNEPEKWLLEALYVRGCRLTDLAVSEKISLAGMKKRRERLLKKLKETTPHPFKE
ncbi:ECF subfamily RNA polymerase sigma-24 subunit [Planococcus antarcticus DSM 14505]|uniref:ECF subfamily RNA polymerase sigma-24 subunit n=1 Tax=Planococcus antarcticus DSM 14505 TaxID=1185653 RepID=A0A1C7DFK2_9BACL|nr:sigma-70 family RNA polymerase sigma factor [Planococcus antarcticus]ANU10235.1 RNA polymerase subunit sigma-24 [Planococcus antarcticus DSM 14505]EIM05284.1 ECF subfamily RNA polymerase sigma-24 subunit [Planococcus antarcticus DSM 14505]